MKNETVYGSLLRNWNIIKSFETWYLVKQILCYFRYGRGKPKADNTYAEKIAFVRCALSTQFFRHIIYKGFYRLSPLDSLTFTPRKPSVWRFGRLAAVLWVMIDSPLTAITDCFCRVSISRLLHRHNFEKWKGKTLYKNILKVINTVSLWRCRKNVVCWICNQIS